MLRLVAGLAILLGVSIVKYGVATASPQIGTATVELDTTACLLMRGPDIRAGERIFVLLPPGRVVDGVVVSKLTQACDSTVDVDEPGTFYLARLRYALNPFSKEVGVAIYDRTARVVYENGEIVFYTNDATSPLRIRHCYSMEGEHFSAWRGHRRTWHAYHYIGYDIEGNCTDEDAGE